MYVSKYWWPKSERERAYRDHVCGMYPLEWSVTGRTFRDGKRRFVVAPDGRAEEVDEEELRRGVIPRLEIEQIASH